MAAEKIEIYYEFRGLSDKEKGALYEYMVIEDGEEYAAITITYALRARQHPKFDCYTGGKPGQKADPNTFDIFQHYYLGALRDRRPSSLPEAHLHPQLQLNLYNFLKKMNSSDKCQLFITTHSPNQVKKKKMLERYIDVTRSEVASTSSVR